MGTSCVAAEVTAIVPNWQRVTELADLADIFDPAVQVCSWQRTIDPAIERYLAGLQKSAESQVIETLVPGDQPGLDALPEAPGRTALIEDLALLGEVVSELMDCQAVGLRLTRIGHAMCPGWHVDRVGIRLVCTYQGPGTQWLDDQDLDRSDLVAADKSGDPVEAIPGEIVLLKGALWQGNAAFGAIHRSPEPDATTALRTLVTLDPLWRD